MNGTHSPARAVRALGIGIVLAGAFTSFAHAAVSVGYGQATSDVANRPAASITPAQAQALHQKIIGGGARTNYSGAGSLLEYSFPQNPADKANGVPWGYSANWVAGSRDHEVADPATISAFDVVLIDTQEQYIVRQFQAEGAVAPHPHAEVMLPAGFVMTGGGCGVEEPDSAAGNMLVASYPVVTTNPDGSVVSKWVCDSKDHDVPSPAGLGAYVIGVKPANTSVKVPAMCISQAVSAVAAHPSVQVGNTCMPGGRGFITGGGALAQTNGPGQLLTGSFPIWNGPAVVWAASSKDHMHASPGTVTTFAIVVDFDPPVRPIITRPTVHVPGSP